MAYLLDSCILVDLLRRKTEAEAAVARLRERPSVCPVSALELFAGARSQQSERKIEALLRLFRSVTIDASAFRAAGSFMRHYRASHELEIADALIAATAEAHGLKLATLNVKHFPMFPRLKPAY